MDLKKIQDFQILDVVLKNCIAETREVPSVLFAKSIDDIVQHVRWANNEKKKLYPISTGNNWGYGSKLPVTDGTHILDLSLMNNITYFNNETGIISIQPGVTYGQLYDYLSQFGMKWLTPTHGAGPSCSVLGNILERGYGVTANVDHFDALVGMVGVTGGGEIYKSAFEALGFSELAKTFKWGIGPYMEGIFTQSNLAVIAEVTIKLEPRFESAEMFFLYLGDSELESGVEFIRQCKRQFKGLVSGIQLLNRERVLSMFMDYPDQLKKPFRPIPEEQLERMAKTQMVSDWVIAGAICGKKYLAKPALRELKKMSQGFCKRRIFISDRRLKLLQKLACWFPRLGSLGIQSMVGSLTNAYRIFNGEPLDFALALAYWIHPHASYKPGANPAHDGCGIKWYAPLLPLEPQKVRRFVEFVREVSTKYEVNSLITISAFTDTSGDCTIPILFDPLEPASVEKSQIYINELFSKGSELGVFPYRLAINQMFRLKTSSNSPIYKALKLALDPNGVIAPGRYLPE